MAAELSRELYLLGKYQREVNEGVGAKSVKAIGALYTAKAFEEASQRSLAYQFQMLVADAAHAKEVPDGE